MILYFAGSTGDVPLEKDFTSDGLKHRLLSFSERESWGEGSFEFWMGPESPSPFFLDSGAYSAMTRGIYLDIKQYCEWIRTNEQHLAHYAALDVIGDWKASARNYAYMCDQGLRAIPTFHFGSPMHELKRLLSVTDHIALGGVVGRSHLDVKPWLDQCFKIITDRWPKKVHLFGVLAQWALERYPLFSADGSSAIVGAGWGRLSYFEEGKMNIVLAVDYARERMDGHILDFVSTAQVSNGSAHKARRRMNVIGFLGLERHVTDLWASRGVSW